MGSGGLGDVKASAGFGFSHAVSGEVEAVGVVDEAVEDGVGEGGVADDFAPLIDGNLAGDQCRSPAVAVFEDLEEVDALSLDEDLQAPVVEDQQVDPGEALEETGVASVATCEGQSLEQPWDALIKDRSPVAAGLVA